MIEVPSELLNALFMLLIVFANISRAKQRSTGEGAFGP
jgi:hypothetical protein